MTPLQVEEKIIELMYRQPFAPFIVEFNDGRSLEIVAPNLAIAGGGACFIDSDGVLVDFEFDQVKAIRLATAAGAA